MSAVLQTELGAINFSDPFIASLVGHIVTNECYGVAGMSSKKATDGISELLKKDNLKRGVIVKTDKSNQLIIDLYIIVEYGISIAATCSNIIDTVKYNLEKTTGLTVSQVNVIVNAMRV